MKKKIYAVVLAIVLLFVFISPLSSYAGPGWRGHPRWWVGHPGWWGYPGWWGPRFYWGGPVVGFPYPYAYPYPYPYYVPPPVVTQEPPVYSEPEQQQSDYWYYCQNPQGYYPYIKSCPGGWMKVVPNVTPPHPGEEGMAK